MSEDLNLKQVERRAWQSTFQDGLYDLFLGWVIVWMGIIFILSKTPLSDPALTAINLCGYSLAVILLILGKHYITRPRIGWVKFGPRRRIRVNVVTAILSFLLLASFSLTLLSIVHQQSLLGAQPAPFTGAFLLGAFFLVFFGLAAFFLDYPRLYLIAVMFALPEIARMFFLTRWNIDIGFLAFMVPGAVVIVMGVIVLRRFLRQHPLAEGRNG